MPVPSILVIEDDPNAFRLYDRVLSSAEYHVVHAETLEAARALLDKNHFNLILCDMQLGSERAIELLTEVAGTLQASGTSIVAVSGQEQYRRMCQELGVDFFLSKPVSINALVGLVDRITVGNFNRKIPLVLDTAEMMRISISENA